MFGRRKDGRAVKNIDPIIALTPYLMPMRCDAQVMLHHDVPYEPLARYIQEKSAEGVKLTFMELFIAAFVRAVSQLPETNRFIVNKRIYARTQLTVSFVVLKSTDSETIEENTIKCHFDPADTIYDVAERVRIAIEDARREQADNATMKVAQALTRPIFANTVVAIARLLDRYGIMPRFLLEASPFHTSLFLTNMASIGMPTVNHHIYNFGTTSMFFSIGAVKRVAEPTSGGTVARKRFLPIGITADERICAGAMYGKLIGQIMRALANPAMLETPPERVCYDEGNEYHLPMPKRARLRLRKEKPITLAMDGAAVEAPKSRRLRRGEKRKRSA